MTILAQHTSPKSSDRAGINEVAAGAKSNSNMDDGPQHVEALLEQLTLEEMVGLVSGRDFWHNHGVPRLGVRPICMTDGPFGARGLGLQGPPSCLTPCGAALGATWDEDLIAELGQLLAEETRSKGADILLGPSVNLQRVPLSGRYFEFFSEDPYLTSRMAVAYIRSIQANGVGCCVKHLVGNEQEHGRMAFSSEIGEEALRNTYLMPFEAAVREAHVMAVMTAYNRLNGTYCSEHSWLLQQLLKGEWGFKGLVMSDWGGSHSTAATLLAGLDLEMPGSPTMNWGKKLLEEVEAGKIPREALRERARTVLGVMSRLGLLQPPTLATSAQTSAISKANLLRRAASESVVLLKNEGNCLPIQRGCSVAVIGAGATSLSLCGGGSSQVALPAETQRSVAEALRCRNFLVRTELGCDTVLNLEPWRRPFFAAATQGAVLDMEIFMTEGWPEGKPTGRTQLKKSSAEAVFRGLVFASSRRNPLDPSQKGPWSARFRTCLTAPSSGTIELSVGGSGRARLWFRNAILIEIPSSDGLGQPHPVTAAGCDDFNPHISDVRATVQLMEGEKADIEVEWVPCRAQLPRLLLGFRLRDWADEDELIARAVSAAEASDVAVVLVGTDDAREAEGRDAVSMDLPGRSEELVCRVFAANPRTVVCLNTGSPKNLQRILPACKSLVLAYFGGQEGANGLAAVLLEHDPGNDGHFGPSGRLASTWPVSLRNLPLGQVPNGRYPGQNGKVAYEEGDLVAYRWCEATGTSACFPFGFGLSYTSFAYLGMELTDLGPSDGFEAHVRVANVGSRSGKEVIQLYIAPTKPASGPKIPRVLAAFRKVLLHPGEQVSVSLFVRRGSFIARFPEENAEFDVFVGSSSATLPLTQRGFVVPWAGMETVKKTEVE